MPRKPGPTIKDAFPAKIETAEFCGVVDITYCARTRMLQLDELMYAYGGCASKARRLLTEWKRRTAANTTSLEARPECTSEISNDALLAPKMKSRIPCCL